MIREFLRTYVDLFKLFYVNKLISFLYTTPSFNFCKKSFSGYILFCPYFKKHKTASKYYFEEYSFEKVHFYYINYIILV